MGNKTTIKKLLKDLEDEKDEEITTSGLEVEP